MGPNVLRFWRDEDGATAIEYGLIASLLAISCIVAFTAFGQSLSGMFGYVSTEAGTAMAGH